jgi:hypothetical protein
VLQKETVLPELIELVKILQADNLYKKKVNKGFKG